MAKRNVTIYKTQKAFQICVIQNFTKVIWTTQTTRANTSLLFYSNHIIQIFYR